MTRRRARRVLVLNHFAAPRGHAGGTRHVELFARLEGWDHLILAGNRNYLTGATVEGSPGFRTVAVTGFTANGLSRIVNWISYAVNAFFRGLLVGRSDVVYASSPHLLAGLTGWALAVVKRAAFVLEIRDLWPRVLVDMGQLSESSLVYRVLVALESFLYSRATRIIVMAEGSRAALVSRGVAPAKIVYIPNGADTVDFIPSAPRDELRAKFGFVQFTAVYAGAHGPANGLDLLLDAVENLNDSSIEVVLVGGGVSKAALVQDAARRGLRNVRFLDSIPKTEIPDLLNAADLGLHVLANVELFRTAVSPNKVFDYMAAGLPVLTNCPGLVSDLVRTAECGLAVQPADLERGLMELADLSEKERNEFGLNGMTWISENQSRTAAAHLLEITLGSALK